MFYFLKSVGVVGALLFAGSSFASLSQFVGTWVNTDSNTRGITKVVVTASTANRVMVKVWGKCHPTDCDWGSKNAVPFAPTVSSNISREARAMVAVYDKGFALTTLVMKPNGRRGLVLDSFTEFARGDSRTDYHQSYSFRKMRRRRPYVNEADQ